MTPSYRDEVQPNWVDANDHMNLAYFVLVFDRATEAAFNRLGIGDEYRQQANCALFAVEAHTLYEREVRGGASLDISTAIAAADRKRLHLVHEMRSDGQQLRAAAQELMYLHVDLSTRRSTPFPATVADRLRDAVDAVHPDWLGRRIALPG